MENVLTGSAVITSDWHSFREAFDKYQKYYLDEFDYAIILGDATDRGENYDGKGSVELLINIMDFCNKNPGRVYYLAGNHDQYLYHWMMALIQNDNEEKQAYANAIMRNGGSKTLTELENLYKTNRNKFEKLLNWLGNLPLQLKIKNSSGNTYCLAHALFNEKLYQKNSGYNLRDLYRASKNNPKEYQENSLVLWFRKGKDSYNKEWMPPKGQIMVIGHTPPSSRVSNLDLEANGYITKVYCIDLLKR